MPKPIRRVAVLGAGVMGSGIAAHLANAGVDVLLLDIVPPNLSDAEKKDPAARNRFAAGGLEKALKNKPALFFHPSRAIHVSVGNFDDDLAKVKDCDLVVEAIIEKMEAKQALFTKLEALTGPDTVVASNTSGLRIVEMLQGRSQSFKERFLVMHFFNPVRYMKLLELVTGPDTRRDVLERIRWFGEDALGKGIVVGKDTPNFVGNRIGTYSMMVAIHQMLADGLEPSTRSRVSRWDARRAQRSARRTSSVSIRSFTSPTTVTPRSPTTRNATSSRCRRSFARWSSANSSATRRRAASTRRPARTSRRSIRAPASTARRSRTTRSRRR
jgi:3-hydroxyacyl-CoA dehydrogenase